MRQINEVAAERDAMHTIVELTSAFEGIASMHISQIKDQVQNSELFFAELWKIYRQLRVDELFRFGRGQSTAKVINKELMILITSEGGLSGDIDEKLVNLALSHYNKDKNDIVVVGRHGATRLTQSRVPYIASFRLPERDRNINVTPLALQVQKYRSTTVFYQSYISLMRQDVKSIELGSAVTQRGKTVAEGQEIISELTYIFEPSTYEVVDYLERSMMQITLSEVILESKLAQYASRFKAMSAARDKADESYDDLKILYSRAQRHQKDERLKEVINGLRKATV